MLLFAKIKKYAKGVSIIILILFVINATGNISKFAEPGKVEINEFIIPETPEEVARFEGALRRKQLSLILAGKMNPTEATELKKLFLEG